MAANRSNDDEIEMPPFKSWTVFKSMVTDKRTIQSDLDHFPVIPTKSVSLGKKTVISPDFLVWKFCGKTQFLHSFKQISRDYRETVSFCKISTPGNQVKLRYFSQCLFSKII